MSKQTQPSGLNHKHSPHFFNTCIVHLSSNIGLLKRFLDLLSLIEYCVKLLCRYCETSENECGIIQDACVFPDECKNGRNTYTCANDNYQDTNPYNCTLTRENCKCTDYSTVFRKMSFRKPERNTQF